MNANKINALSAFSPDNPQRPVMINRKFCFRTVTPRERFRRPALPAGSIDWKSGLPDDASMMTGQDSWTDSQFRAAIPMTLIEQFL